MRTSLVSKPACGRRNAQNELDHLLEKKREADISESD